MLKLALANLYNLSFLMSSVLHSIPMIPALPPKKTLSNTFY